MAISRGAVQPRLCHPRAAPPTVLSTVSLVPARRLMDLMGNWLFVPLRWVSGTVALGFVINDYLEDGVTYVV